MKGGLHDGNEGGLKESDLTQHVDNVRQALMEMCWRQLW